MLSDREIRALIATGVLANAGDGNVGPVTYDLTTKSFYSNKGEMDKVTLKPGESAYVATKETISLPSNLTASVLLRNSRIRQGLTLDAPLYFPGHATRVFFRITNISADIITLDRTKGIAQIIFERVDGEVEHPYSGTFNNEFDYRGMADYADMYHDDIQQLDNKIDEVKGIERRMYGNVLALMAIFAAIFTLVNVNVNVFQAEFGPTLVIVANLATLGSFAFLSGLIALAVHVSDRKTCALPWLLSTAAFVAAVLVAMVF